jgi:hypothetical protein
VFLALGTSMLACDNRSSFVMYDYFVLFQALKNLKKDKKNQIFQKQGTGNMYYFFNSTESLPWTKQILPFVHQELGSSMTLGSCSRYIELCPPPFGYFSKHIESLCCLLHREIMSMSCCLNLIIFCVFVQGNFHPT